MLLGCAVVASCGGGGGGGGNPTPAPPPPPTTFTVGGTITGLAGSGLELRNNSTNPLAVATNGAFMFSGTVTRGTTYDVTIAAQPKNPWQTCVVAAGSGTVVTNVTSVSVNCTTTLSSEYFALVENAFDTFLFNENGLPGNDPAVPGVLKVFDGNGDGRPDILFTNHYFRWDYNGNDPAFDFVNYFENVGIGGFQNRTTEVLGFTTFGAATRKTSFYDINSDGVDDVVFSNSREDGRRDSDSAFSTRFSANLVLISRPGGGYSSHWVGEAAWSHHVAIANIDADPQPEIIDGNYTYGNRVYDILSDGSWTETTAQIHNVAAAFDANDMILADFNGDGCVDTVTSRMYPEHQDRSHFTGNCQGSFQLVTHFPFGSLTFFVPGESWSGDPIQFKVADIDGEWFAGISNFWSEAADFDNDGDLDVLYATESFAVTEEERANNFIVEGGEYVTHLTLLRNTASGFEQMPAIAGGVLPDDMGLYWARVVDVNADGFLDLVVDDHLTWRNRSDGLNDSILLNNGEGIFTQNSIGLAAGSLIDSHRNVTPLDFDGDGLMDFVLRRGSLCLDCGAENMILIRGIRAIPGSAGM